MITRLPAEAAARLRRQPATYPDVGATRSRLPAGYRHLSYGRPVGHGAEQFERAAAALLGWQMHDRAGLRPVTSTDRAAEGEVAVLHFGWRRLAIPVPVRVVYLVAARRRRGFAYGTLPGHPETGEEAFVLEHRPDDSVVFTITAFSNPARWFARMGGPVTRLVQRWMTARYASCLRELTRQVPG
jgi:uncharacterized protein (UPF0548 family)